MSHDLFLLVNSDTTVIFSLTISNILSAISTNTKKSKCKPSQYGIQGDAETLFDNFILIINDDVHVPSWSKWLIRHEGVLRFPAE
ncbi:hypothetical protein [Bacillus sp. ISL-7]|uniref:hypothetical protein n=1 Tax=Bacillus sp. ISL-7 TaxID=2819136 RepID=UPI001BEC5359|nr:hypothetical protein [Bacillus sp. ISL-7]MBT2738812.1 hypothetical protein [Bacillus sp. ISL-7]